MTAGEYNFTLEQGATFAQTFYWKDSTGAAINITGYTARMSIRQTVDSPVLLALTSSPSAGITLTGATGQIDLAITATQTAALNFDRAVYDLELINGATVYRLFAGTITLSKEVTR